MNTFVSGVLTALEPWKAVIASVAGFLAALLGILGGMLKQRRVADVTTPEQPAFSTRGRSGSTQTTGRPSTTWPARPGGTRAPSRTTPRP